MSDAPDSAIEIESSQPSSALVGQVKSFVAGGVGGICAVLTGHPFDLVKVRQQTASSPLSAIGAAKAILTKDGPRGFYRGVAAPLVGVTPMFAVSFWGYDVGQRLVRSVTGTEAGKKLSIAEISAAGFFSAIPMTAITAPFERVKVILQLQGQGNLKEGQKQFTGAMDVVKHLYREGGMRSVFKGSVATLSRDGPGSALYFAAYEYIKRKGADADGNVPLSTIVFAGGMAGIAMWVPVFPIDTIKSNLQSSDKPQSIAQVTRSIYQRGGMKAFFPGVGAALARSFPANAATFLGVEMTYKFFNGVGL